MSDQSQDQSLSELIKLGLIRDITNTLKTLTTTIQVLIGCLIVLSIVKFVGFLLV